MDYEYYENEVFIEDTIKRITIVDLINGNIMMFSKKFYHLWWAAYMFRNYGSLNLHYNKIQSRVIEFKNVNGHNGGSSLKIKTLEEAKKHYLKKEKVSN